MVFLLRIHFLCLLLYLAHGAPPLDWSEVSEPSDQYYEEYNGHQVLRLSLRHQEEWRLIMDHVSAMQPNHTIDVWKVTKSGVMDMMVAPDDQPVVHKVLKHRSVPTTVLLDDVSRVIKKEKKTKGNDTMSWDAYHRAGVIFRWMDDIAEKHKKMASVKIIGRSFEGRPMKVLKIDTGKSKKKIFLDGGIHAREWISSAVATYVMKQFLDHREKHKDLVDSFQWHFLPLFNPDGYEFSHTTKRLWRKTRSKRGQSCPGVDANRNFPFHWKQKEEAHASPCAENYPGESPSSENCVKAFERYIHDINTDKSLVAYYSLHAYGQLWLLPSSFNGKKPRNFRDMLEAGRAGAKAIKNRSGTTYSVGDPYALLNYHATGTSSDWVLEKAGVPYSFVLELSPRISSFLDRINPGNFMLDAKKIKEVGEDVIAGLRASLHVIKKKLELMD